MSNSLTFFVLCLLISIVTDCPDSGLTNVANAKTMQENGWIVDVSAGDTPANNAVYGACCN